MTNVVNVHDAKTHFSKYLDRAASGHEVIFGKHGKPVAKLVPLPQKQPRKPGILKGKGYWIADDFDETPPEILEALDRPIDEHTA